MEGSLCPRCPAALPVAGPYPTGPSIVCGVLRQERTITDQIVHGRNADALLTVAENPSVVHGFCCGSALPVIDAVPEEGAAHHTACPIWRAEKHRTWAHRRTVAEPKRRGNLTPFGMGETAPGVLRDDLPDRPEVTRHTTKKALDQIDPPKVAAG